MKDGVKVKYQQDLSSNFDKKENENFVSKEECKTVDIEKVVETKKQSISSITIEDLKGRLLVNLRKIGSEMLWNIIQNVSFETKGNTLKLTTSSAGDQDLLDRAPSRARIEEALNEFMPFDLQINLSAEEKSLDAVDEAAERIKSIFGNDIVIIK